MQGPFYTPSKSFSIRAGPFESKDPDLSPLKLHTD
jgi:hypothetical protein